MKSNKYCWTVCKTAEEYIEVALSLETLAYHNKNYLDSYMCDNAHLNEEIRLLLLEALKKINKKDEKE